MAQRIDTKATDTIPTTAAVKEGFEHVAKTLKEQERTNEALDTKGQQMAREAAGVLQTTKELLVKRNPDELLQIFLQHSQELAQRAKQEVEKNQGELREKWNKVGEFAPRMKNVIYDLLVNPDFQRELLNSVHVLAYILERIQEPQQKPFQQQQQQQQPITYGQGHSQQQQQQQQFGYSGDLDLPATTQMFDQMSDDDKKKIVQQVCRFHHKIASLPKYNAYRHEFQQMWEAIIGGSQNKMENQTFQNEMKKLYDEGIQVLQRFVGAEPDLKNWSDHCIHLGSRIMNDQEAKKFWDEWRGWSEKLIQRPEGASDAAMCDEGVRLLNDSIRILRGKYAHDLQSVINQWRQVLETIQNDELNKKLSEQLKRFGRACSGSTLQTLTQARHLVAPVLQDIFREIPLPDFEEKTDTSTYSFKEMKLKGSELSLEDCVMKIKLGLKDALVFKLWLKNINITIDNVHFAYNRTSMPTFSDSGVCTVKITAPKWYLKWVVKESKNEIPSFELSDIQSRFKTFAVNIEEAKHPWIDSVVLTLFTNSIRKRVEETIKQNLEKHADLLTTKFNEFFSEDAKSHESHWSDPKFFMNWKTE